jgi:hypothetical protein
MVLVLSTDTFCVSYKYFPSGAKFIGQLFFYARCCANLWISDFFGFGSHIMYPLGFESRRESGPDNFYSP